MDQKKLVKICSKWIHGAIEQRDLIRYRNACNNDLNLRPVLLKVARYLTPYTKIGEEMALKKVLDYVISDMGHRYEIVDQILPVFNVTHLYKRGFRTQLAWERSEYAFDWMLENEIVDDDGALIKEQKMLVIPFDEHEIGADILRVIVANKIFSEFDFAIYLGKYRYGTSPSSE